MYLSRALGRLREPGAGHGRQVGAFLTVQAQLAGRMAEYIGKRTVSMTNAPTRGNGIFCSSSLPAKHWIQVFRHSNSNLDGV